MNQRSESIFQIRNGINNMFNSKHYVPILKWKRAEQGALKGLTEESKKHITPLIQFVMPKEKSQEQFEDIVERFENQASQIPEKILEVWGSSSIFVDFSLLFTTPLKVKSLNIILREGYKLGVSFIPVIHLSDDQEIKKAVYSLARRSKSGICLRLVCPDFSDLKKLNQDIADIVLESGGLKEKDIDLLIDIKETEENNNKCTKYLNLSQSIHNLLLWRSFTFGSGSFPKDLSECKLEEENLIPRVDWIAWKGYIEGGKIKRKPSFADYTIQYPIYKRASQFFPPTTSIKYALENEWLILKGKKQKFKMYLANAKLLVDDERFYGRNFSDGDKYIFEKAKHFEVYTKNPAIKGTGSTETWLRTGINHHLVLVVHQISNLP